MEDRKKILHTNAMLETYLFVGKMYWVSIVSLLVLLSLLFLVQDTRLVRSRAVAVTMTLLTLAVARTTTELKVIAIFAASFVVGITTPILLAMT